MPYEYTIDVERRFISTRWWGDLTDQEVFDSQQQIAADPRFSADFSVLLDMTGATSSKLTVDALTKTARAPIYGPKSRRAVVATMPVLFGLARLFDTHREIAGWKGQSRVFTNRDEAMQWLASDSD